MGLGIQTTPPKNCHKSVLVFSSLLPPKKLLGSKEPAFIMKRRRELEAYLQVVIFIPCFQVAKLDILQDTCVIWFDFSKAACLIRSFTFRLFAISWRGTFHRTWPPSLILARCSFSFLPCHVVMQTFVNLNPKQSMSESCNSISVRHPLGCCRPVWAMWGGTSWTKVGQTVGWWCWWWPVHEIRRL